ncbi:MAG: copper amine oxidase N-terminal domain-containing protein, partial [Peptococcaceae bacterium]|nr:copper amine oxidase N-terminal domain-containing protein [Peptococcaceae bacterium]
DVKWVPETESIVAEGNGLKVVMNLGSKVAVVNGEEVALDVAPYSVNGRTVVPVGFITGTFGINPTFTYNADGTIADIIFAK